MNKNEQTTTDIERCVAYVPSARHIQRFPIEYEPASATVVNVARLPKREEMEGMQIAHRERTRAEDLDGRAFSAITMLPAGLFLLVLLGFSLTRFIPPTWVIIGSALISFSLLVKTVASGRITPDRIARSLFGPPLIAILMYAFSSVVDNRLLITAALSAITLVLVFRVASNPLDFYWGWLTAHPRLRCQQREEMMRQNPLQPTLWVPCVALAIAIIVPIISTTLAIVAIVAICLVVCCRDLEQARWLLKAPRMLGLYLSYGESNVGTPGVWIPRETIAKRRRHVRVVAALLFFSLGFGLRYYFPTDLIRGPIAEQIALAVPRYGYLRNAFPGVDWTKLPAPTPSSARLARPEIVDPIHDSANRLPDEEERIDRENRRRLQQYQSAIAGDANFRQEYRLLVAKEFIDKEIGDRPYTWVVAATAGLINNRPFFAWTFPFSFVLALAIPNLVLLATYRNAIIAAHKRERELDGLDESGLWKDDSRTPWEWRVERVTQSTHVAPDPLLEHRQVREADHLFLGVEPYRSFPVLLDRSLLNQHCYIVGETGSGKTSLGIMPLLIQLMRQPRVAPVTASKARAAVESGDSKEESTPGTDDQPPIVILDIKGDPALFNLAKREAEERRLRNGITDPNDPKYAFRFFTPEPGRASQFFNPFRSMQSKNRSVMQLGEILMESLSLAHGEGYGRSYYTRKSRQMLLDALDRSPQPASLTELYDILKSKKADSDAFELAATIGALALYDNLATDDKRLPEQETIHMPTALEHRQVIYFWLPAATESVSVREIGKLALFSLLTAAIDRQRDRKPGVDTYLFIDEFQRIAGENFRIILEQARSFGLRAILANQSINDLKTSSMDLRPTIQTNTRVKMYFSVTDPSAMQDLSTSSGEEVMYTWSTGYGKTLTSAWGLASETESQVTKPRMTTSDIIRSSDHPLEFILKVSQGSGYTQFGGIPIPVQCPWPISFADYGALASTPWPEKTGKQPKITKSPKQIDQQAQAEKNTKMGSDIGRLVEELAEWSGAGAQPPDDR